MKKQLQLALIFSLICLFGYAQLRVGDPGVTINQSTINANKSNYPQMERWAKAGARGGIPFINSFNKVVTITSGNSDKINAAINAMSNDLSTGQIGLIRLANGDYNINKTVNMKSNVSLEGASRNGVVCTINMTSKDAFRFDNVMKSGIYSLTIKGGWSEPKYLWNYSLDANREFSNSNISVKLNRSTDCWLDKVTILNSAKDPLRCPADHNTFRDLIVDGCKRKAGGAEGYFFIQGRDNLITGCQITHLRHISLQGGNVEFNVVYDNDFRQEVSFHSGDAGNNLIANNKITLPSDMPPIEQGEQGPYPETENGKPIYFAIMGPWSTRHQNSAKPNYLYKNDCVQNNHNYGSSRPWSENDKVYFGPKKLGLSIQERIDNFPVFNGGNPQGGTLYAVNLDGGGNVSVSVSSVSISQSTASLSVGDTVNFNETVSPNNASDKSVTWSSSNISVATVSSTGNVIAVSNGVAIITVTTNDGNKKASASVTVSAGTSPPPTSDGEKIVHMRKRNAIGFALGGGGAGGVTGQNIRLYTSRLNNVNQHWVEIDRGNGFYSYKKRDTNFCMDAGNGGANNQNVALGACSDTNQNQQWKKISVDSDYFRLQKRNASGFSIDGGVGGAINQNIKIWTSNDGSNRNQHWEFTVVNQDASLSLNETFDDNISSNQILVYPNPFKSNIILKLNNNNSNFNKAQLYDIRGALFYSKQINNTGIEIQLDFDKLNLNKGLYILKISGGKAKSSLIKLIKN